MWLARSRPEHGRPRRDRTIPGRHTARTLRVQPRSPCPCRSSSVPPFRLICCSVALVLLTRRERGQPAFPCPRAARAEVAVRPPWSPRAAVAPALLTKPLLALLAGARPYPAYWIIELSRPSSPDASPRSRLRSTRDPGLRSPGPARTGLLSLVPACKRRAPRVARLKSAPAARRAPLPAPRAFVPPGGVSLCSVVAGGRSQPGNAPSRPASPETHDVPLDLRLNAPEDRAYAVDALLERLRAFRACARHPGHVVPLGGASNATARSRGETDEQGPRRFNVSPPLLRTLASPCARRDFVVQTGDARRVSATRRWRAALARATPSTGVRLSPPHPARAACTAPALTCRSTAGVWIPARQVPHLGEEPGRTSPSVIPHHPR